MQAKTDPQTADARDDPGSGHAPEPPTIPQLAGLLAALWSGEVALVRLALAQIRRALLLALPGLLLVGALLLVAIGQSGFALVAGLLAAGLDPALAHLAAALVLLLLAGLVLWSLYRRFVRAGAALRGVAHSLRADLQVLTRVVTPAAPHSKEDSDDIG